MLDPDEQQWVRATVTQLAGSFRGKSLAAGVAVLFNVSVLLLREFPALVDADLSWCLDAQLDVAAQWAERELDAPFWRSVLWYAVARLAAEYGQPVLPDLKPGPTIH